MSTIATILLFLCFCAPFILNAAPNPAPAAEIFPQLIVPRMKAPMIDGKASDSEWSGTAETSVFVSSLDNKPYTPRTIEKCESLGITSDKLVVCPYDENMGPIALSITKWIKDVSPKTRIIMDAATTDLETLRAYDNLMDVWMPHLRTLNQKGYQPFYDYLLARKAPIMTYYYTSGNSEKLKSPYHDFALNFWLCFKYNLRGMAYWAAGQYYGDPWHRQNYNGLYDTSLIYPAGDKVIPSRRLFGWKRGFQDFQLLKLAEQKLNASGDQKALAELRKNVETVTTAPHEPQRAEAVREYCRSLLKH